MIIHISRMIFIGIFSFTALSLLAYQGIEIVHSFYNLFHKK
ncbi:hypothetical protein NYQ66_10425 [Aquibacillus koreensis]|nr:hypothetical protein [Aquibacillus koreensis]MCT2536169.1 hypothetical protein [Aquibacillus koreensis]